MENLKYKIQNAETGVIIEENLTFSEAEKLLKEYEQEDEKDGIYEPGFYEIKKQIIEQRN